jgi:uncharacterized protein
MGPGLAADGTSARHLDAARHNRGVDYPDYNPNIDNPPLSDAELDALDTLLQGLPVDNAMNIEGMDGYLTALLVGPPLLQQLKSADWLPAVWGGDGEGALPFASQKQRKRTALLVLRHLHGIARQLRMTPNAWEPVFSVAEVDGGDAQRDLVDAEDWCIGFLFAVALAPEAWAPLFDDPVFGPALVPIALLGGDESGLSEADVTRLADPAARDELSRAVVDGVLRLNERLAGPATPG